MDHHGKLIEAMKSRRARPARLRGVARGHDTSSAAAMNLQRMARRRALGPAVSVHKKLRELQRLVPGGRDLCAEQLFLRTADYISELRTQVQLLRTLSTLYMP